MSTWKSRSPAFLRKEWWWTRPIRRRAARGRPRHTTKRKIDGVDDNRRAILIDTGEAVQIGPIEKMSKSKRNTVDPDDIIGSFGADTARWFMLSDSPPERDVIWTEEGVQGAWRFLQRLWRLVNDAAAIAAAAPKAPPGAFLGAGSETRNADH